MVIPVGLAALLLSCAKDAHAHRERIDTQETARKKAGWVRGLVGGGSKAWHCGTSLCSRFPPLALALGPSFHTLYIFSSDLWSMWSMDLNRVE